MPSIADVVYFVVQDLIAGRIGICVVVNPAHVIRNALPDVIDMVEEITLLNAPCEFCEPGGQPRLQTSIPL